LAFSHGKSAAFYQKDAAGTERNLSSYLSSAGLDRGQETAETSALGDSSKKFIAGLLENGYKLDGHYDPTVESYLVSLLGISGGSFFRYFPAGSATGKTYYEGTAIATSVNIDTPVDDKASIAAEFQVTGAVTYGTA
jgi:hypothetical protein